MKPLGTTRLLIQPPTFQSTEISALLLETGSISRKGFSAYALSSECLPTMWRDLITAGVVCHIFQVLLLLSHMVCRKQGGGDGFYCRFCYSDIIKRWKGERNELPCRARKSKENGMVVYLGKQDGKKNEQKERVIETTGRRVKNEQ